MKIPAIVASRLVLWMIVSAVLALSTGCRTPVEIRRVDTSEAGWRVQEGQALWRPGRRYPEMAGELMAATHQDGRGYVQFSKTPFLILQAQTTQTHWAIAYPPQKRSFGGPGNPPQRFTWLYLQRALSGESIPAKYHFERRTDGGWRLENLRTGESIEGFLTP
jgi:hypothetical protein